MNKRNLISKINQALKTDVIAIPSYPIDEPYFINPVSSLDDPQLLEIPYEVLETGFGRISIPERIPTAELFRNYLALDKDPLEKKSNDPLKKESYQFYNKKIEIFSTFFNYFFSLYEGPILPFNLRKKELFFYGSRVLFSTASNQTPFVDPYTNHVTVNRFYTLWKSMLKQSVDFIETWIGSLKHLSITPQPRIGHNTKNSRLRKYLYFSERALEDIPSHSYFLHALAHGKELFGLEKFLCDFIRNKKVDQRAVDEYIGTLSKIPYKSRYYFYDAYKDLEKFKFPHAAETLIDLVHGSGFSRNLLQHECNAFRKAQNTDRITELIPLLQNLVKNDPLLLENNLEHIVELPLISIIPHLQFLDNLTRLVPPNIPEPEKTFYVKMGYLFIESHAKRVFGLTDITKKIDTVFVPLLRTLLMLPDQQRKMTIENTELILPLMRVFRSNFPEIIEPVIEGSIHDAEKTKYFVQKMLSYVRE